MKKITLPKWAVVSGLGSTRMIHIGNGEFVCADTQTPKVIESCTPDDKAGEAPGNISAVDAPEHIKQWILGAFNVDTEEPVPETVPSAADAANAELDAATAPEGGETA